jgi:uncharacterized LabA/DUF88 family protein
MKKNYQCGKMLRQDRDFSTIGAGKRQFEEQWRRGKSVTYMGLISGPNKADDTCGRTTVTGTMDRGFTVLRVIEHIASPNPILVFACATS